MSEIESQSDQIPFNLIWRVGDRSLTYRRLFYASWNLGNFCNYSCSYCWPLAHSHERVFRPTEALLQTLAEIKRQARARDFNAFSFVFAGGEPTLHPGFLDLTGSIAEDPDAEYRAIQVTTNLSQGVQWWRGYAARVAAAHSIGITASWHAEAGVKDPIGFRANFAMKAALLGEFDMNVMINIVMVPDRFEQLFEDARFFHAHGLRIMPVGARGNDGALVSGYTPEMLRLMAQSFLAQPLPRSRRPQPRLTDLPPRDLRGEPSPQNRASYELEDLTGQIWYLDHAHRLNPLNFNRFAGWTCQAGWRSIRINERTGLVTRGVECADKPYGTLADGFTLDDAPKTCVTSKRCACVTDCNLPKSRGPLRHSAVDLMPGQKA